jgi:hypothetical protein
MKNAPVGEMRLSDVNSSSVATSSFNGRRGGGREAPKGAIMVGVVSG